jgi:hypothetical protein
LYLLKNLNNILHLFKYSIRDKISDIFSIIILIIQIFYLIYIDRW